MRSEVYVLRSLLSCAVRGMRSTVPQSAPHGPFITEFSCVPPILGSFPTVPSNAV